MVEGSLPWQTASSQARGGGPAQPQRFAAAQQVASRHLGEVPWMNSVGFLFFFFVFLLFFLVLVFGDLLKDALIHEILAIFFWALCWLFFKMYLL